MLSNNTRHPLLFRYPGGKFYAMDILRPFWSIKHDEYREPFAGGATIFFNKPKVCHNWLNDIDKELMITYKILSKQKTRNILSNKICREIASRERWSEMYREFEPKNDFEIAYRYYYLNRTSFSGKLVSAAWGYRPKRSLPPERWNERIIPCGEKLSGVKFTHCDFEKVITADAKGENVLIYVDPPYFSPPKKKHYRNGFDNEDHLRLCEVLKKTKHKYFLTYDDVPEIRELYKWANIYEAKFIYRVDNSAMQKGKRRIGFELIITNYKISRQLDLF